MADASEDSVFSSSRHPSTPTIPEAADPSALQDASDDEEEELAADFRFLSPSNDTKKIPKRGMKDSDLHGTKLQVSALDTSRDAMHEVIKQERTHNPDIAHGVWDPETNGAWIIKANGKWSSSVGKTVRVPNRWEDEGKMRPLMRLLLLPEEALWLVERGSVFMRWPAEDGVAEDGGLTMSLQAAYATFIGMERGGGLTLEEYSVYQYLRRAGYAVFRAKDNWHNVPAAETLDDTKPEADAHPYHPLWRFFTKASSESVEDINKRKAHGPIVRPGLYRDYKSIYQQLSLVPHHNPQLTPDLRQPTEDSLSVTYHVYRQETHFRKTNPGPPNFYVSVIDATDALIPTVDQLEGLLRQTPFHPPQGTKDLYGGPFAQKLRNGYRHVILAIADKGLTSFVSLADAGFGNSPLWERKPRAGRGGKGGGRGRGRGRGR
ncbi:hypothetical protein BT63DRAFT_441070 [Microthyrium microscopicum]|uniref:tRNA-splicing endonuclease subunit Sen54 N-terminal domain-containing protein n=1 Tax=Microthyrium microscopicum TaxID=703497 RepID=A0A6A6U653_9PEZI|nr:hypothetical protein BT63DRAFT_441070 [Microthyrium microscopicum]